MALDRQQLQSIIKEFTVDAEQLREIAANFRQDLKLGLNDPKDSSLRMLRSYVGLPTGKETGEYLALDFGGTNVRVSRIKLQGAGRFEVTKKVGKPLIVPGEYDYVGVGSTSDQMFDFLAELIDEAIDKDHDTKFFLGHTFSFPSTQTDLYNAKLIIWTKEFATSGVEGEVVNDLLTEALKRRGIENIEPISVINDTVAVLLSAAYQKSDTYIGSIYATGQNNCYVESTINDPNNVGVGGMILNLESGGFMKLTPNRFDIEFDQSSEKPGEQRMEKMVSGRYMGELFGMALAELFNEEGEKYNFTSIDISSILMDDSVDGDRIAAIIKDKVNKDVDSEDAKKIKELAAAIVIRSARLVTASFVGIIWHRTGSGKINRQHIAVDGSVYEKMPLVKENINRALNELLGEEAKNIDTILDNGGSGLGAAISAAMAANHADK
ncbi:MAG: hexokinase [Selenomonadaceae bacterium]|nr:hexokinase [Selenomonadaceae bacterium]MBR1858372.1 hexokinase [Selenomonadaceae bacterium]